jgi:hypothetical protein
MKIACVEIGAMIKHHNHRQKRMKFAFIYLFIHYWGFKLKKKWKDDLIWFNSAKSERNLKFNDDFETNSQVRN